MMEMHKQPSQVLKEPVNFKNRKTGGRGSKHKASSARFSGDSFHADIYDPAKQGIREGLAQSGAVGPLQLPGKDRPGSGGVNRFTSSAARALAPTVAPANARPGLAASQEPTKLTGQARPCSQPRLFAKTKGALTAQLSGRAGGRWEATADQAAHPRASPKPGPQRGLARGSAILRLQSTGPWAVPLIPCPCLALSPLATNQ